MEAKTIRDLRADLPVTSRLAEKPRSQRKYFWIEDDEELTPKAARKEMPLTAWS